MNGEVEAVSFLAKDDDDKTIMNTSQRRRKPKAEDATQQLSAAAIAAAASRKSANRSSRFGGLKGAITRSSLPVFAVNVRSSFSDKLAASCRFNSRGSNSDEEETEPSSTTGDEVNRSQSPEKKAWDSVSTLGLYGPNGPDISAKSISCSAKSLRIPSVPDIDEFEPSTSPKDHHHQGASADQDVSVDLVPEAFLQTNHPSTSPDTKEVKRAKHDKRSSIVRSSKRTSSGSHERNRENKSPTTSTSEAEVEIMRMEIEELKAMLKEKTQTIVKLEVDLELAHDTIHELKKSLVHSRKNEKATGHCSSSKTKSSRQPSGSRSAMNLYRSRLSQTEEYM